MHSILSGRNAFYLMIVLSVFAVACGSNKSNTSGSSQNQTTASPANPASPANSAVNPEAISFAIPMGIYALRSVNCSSGENFSTDSLQFVPKIQVGESGSSLSAEMSGYTTTANMSTDLEHRQMSRTSEFSHLYSGRFYGAWQRLTNLRNPASAKLVQLFPLNVPSTVTLDGTALTLTHESRSACPNSDRATFVFEREVAEPTQAAEVAPVPNEVPQGEVAPPPAAPAVPDPQVEEAPTPSEAPETEGAPVPTAPQAEGAPIIVE